MTQQAQDEIGRSCFEQGPIRPPSEAGSLLLRVSRNCPWNRCTFCSLYKGQEFSLRSAAEVMADIDVVACQVTSLKQRAEQGPLSPHLLRLWHEQLPEAERAPFRAAVHWYQNGLRSVFLQDADALAAGAEPLLVILKHLRQTFPQIERVTSYSRSATIVRCSPSELQALYQAGLSRLHMGLESGFDGVLRKVRKGASQALHIKAGQMVVAAGMELSLYVMPGLGGRSLSSEHARQTAVAINQINPHFIRLRTLAVPDGTPLAEEVSAGRFEPCNVVETVQELLLFIESLHGVDSVVVSDHALNLFEDLQGKLPADKERMLDLLRSFLELKEEQRILYQLGRRAGCFRGMDDLLDTVRRAEAERLCRQLDITADNVEEICAELMKRYI